MNNLDPFTLIDNLYIVYLRLLCHFTLEISYRTVYLVEGFAPSREELARGNNVCRTRDHVGEFKAMM